MHAQDELPERIAIRFHMQGAGCELDPSGNGHFLVRKSRAGRLTCHRNPRPKLVGAVACLHQFVIRHVEQITQPRLFRLLDRSAVDFLIDVAGARFLTEMRQSTRGAHATRYKSG